MLSVTPDGALYVVGIGSLTRARAQAAFDEIAGGLNACIAYDLRTAASFPRTDPVAVNVRTARRGRTRVLRAEALGALTLLASLPTSLGRRARRALAKLEKRARR